MVIIAKDEMEVSLILKESSILSINVTFRAAGTSLSGQAITDSVLLIAGNHWKKYHINENGSYQAPTRINRWTRQLTSGA